MTWGWKVRVLSYSPYSDTTLDVNGKVFRVVRLENDWDFRRGTWLSRLSVVDNAGE